MWAPKEAIVAKIFKKGPLFLIKGILIVMVFLPFVILVRVLRPLIYLRFGELNSERIGHFLMNTELYLSKRDIARQEGKNVSVDIFYFSGPVCNEQLARMWRRELNIWPIAKLIDKVNRLIPGSQAHQVVELFTEKDPQGALCQKQTHLKFTAAEEEFGSKQINSIGMSKGRPFVCFIARDSAYLKTQFPQVNYTYHDYRDTDINNSIPAMQELVARGYTALRMGALVNAPLKEQSEGIIDYASLHRSDFMDIYLSAHCSFFVTDTCGLSAIPAVFRRPVVLVNMIPIGHVLTRMVNNHVITFKKLWLKDEKRFLSFKEIIGSSLAVAIDKNVYEQQGVEIVENTSQEIKDAVLEMEDRLKGVWKVTKEDEDLQKRFWSLFNLDSNQTRFHGLVGAKFLIENRNLLF